VFLKKGHETIIFIITIALLLTFQTGNDFKAVAQLAKASATSGFEAVLPAGSTFYYQADGQWRVMLPNGVAVTYPWN
jgi:hypothetical protein